MASCIIQIIAVVMGCAATLLTAAICGMPSWRVSMIAETNSYGRRIDGQWIGRWDGLWVTCVRQSGIPVSCQKYSQTLLMTPDLKVSRIFISFALFSAFGGCACAIMGMLYDKCDMLAKKHRRCILLLGGFSLIMSGILVLAPVTLVAFNILRDVCLSNCKGVHQQEIGEAIMLALPTVMLFLIGGSIFCWYHPCTCSDRQCICPSEDFPPNVYQEEDNLAQELHVFNLNRRQNQDIVI